MLVTDEIVASMREGSVIVDCAIDQGGCVEGIRETTHSDPVYTAHGVLHYAVGNIPGAVPNTSTYALTNATLPYRGRTRPLRCAGGDGFGCIARRRAQHRGRANRECGGGRRVGRGGASVRCRTARQMIVGRHRDRLLIAVVALAVALAVADSSVVVLALPDLYATFNVSIVTVSWTITAYNLAIVVGAIGVLAIERRVPGHVLAGVGLGLFAVASLWCGLSTSFGLLIVGRTVQGLGAAMALVGAVPVLSAIRGSDEHAIRLWALAGTIGVAVGPALGGFLTQLFSWRSIFLLQAPLAALALVAVFDARVRTIERPPRAEERGRTRESPTPGSSRSTARLVGALFLSVLLLVVVWGWSPIAGAIVVTTLAGRDDRGAQADTRPAAADRGRGRRHRARGRAGGARVPSRVHRHVGGRRACRACGIGLGLLGGVLAPAAVPGNAPGTRAATVSIAARHAGFVLALAIIAPVLSTSLNSAALVATRATTAEVLDSSVSLRTKVSLAFDLRDLIANAPRGEVPDPTVPFNKRGRGDRREATGNPRRCCRRDPRHVDPRVPFVVPDCRAVRDRGRVRGRIVTHAREPSPSTVDH